MQEPHSRQKVHTVKIYTTEMVVNDRNKLTTTTTTTTTKESSGCKKPVLVFHLLHRKFCRWKGTAPDAQARVDVEVLAEFLGWIQLPSAEK